MEPPRIARNLPITDRRFELHYSVAVGLGAGIGFSANIVTGLGLALLYLLLVLKRSGWSAERKRLFWEERGRMSLFALAMTFLFFACVKGLLDNWPEVKRGIVEGYRTFR